MLKRSEHTPPHLLSDHKMYFVTGAIYLKRRWLANPDLKNRLLELLSDYFSQSGWEFCHWVILDNHYYLIAKSRKGDDLPGIIRRVHRTSAIEIRKKTGCEKPVWWNYWDYCMRDEIDYMIRLNYLLNNPVKHGYVKSLHDYPFSSFPSLYKKVGREELVRRFQAHPEYKSLMLKEKDDDF